MGLRLLPGAPSPFSSPTKGPSQLPGVGWVPRRILGGWGVVAGGATDMGTLWWALST